MFSVEFFVIMISVVYLLFILAVLIVLLKFYLYLKKSAVKRRQKRIVTIGFFHPYCNAGGGGERVLWTAIRAVQEKYKYVDCVVYSGDSESTEDILKNVEQRFNISLLRTIQVIHLSTRFLVEARCYPICTLIMQSVGSVVLALEALLKYGPDVYIDTMGYAWTLPVFKWLGSCRVAAYVHFPTISTDMLDVVQSRKVAVNNSKFISNSRIFSNLKLIYYRIFAFLYGFVGRQAEVIMVNSTWTKNHILHIWRKPQSTFTVYPPCDVSEFNNIQLKAKHDEMRILSIAQFRPEKNHELQIKAFNDFLNKIDHFVQTPRLVLIGSCRHEEDYQRVQSLKDLCSQLKISEKVVFKVNLSFKEIIDEMKKSSVALHTMRDEHFGIGIVECMSAGLIMIAHDSGGPKMDIVINYNGNSTGFLATDKSTFADAIEKVWGMDNQDLYEIRKNARESVSRFSVLKFEQSFLSAFHLLLI